MTDRESAATVRYDAKLEEPGLKVDIQKCKFIGLNPFSFPIEDGVTFAREPVGFTLYETTTYSKKEHDILEAELALLAERERFQICGYQRRLKWQTPEAEWFSCPTKEATDPFESVPSFEYRAIYTAIRSPAHD